MCWTLYSLFTHTEEKVRKACTKHMGVGGGVCQGSEQEEQGCRHPKKNRDLLLTLLPCYPVIALLLTAPPLDQLTKWYILNFDQANKT